MNISVGSTPESKQQIAYYATAVIAALLVFGAGYFVYVKPAAPKAAFLAANESRLQAQATAASQTFDQATALSKVQLADLFDLTRAMPDKLQMADVLVVLGRLAHNSGVQFVSIKPDVVVPLAGYQAQPMDIQLQGKFYDLMEFLYELRHLVDVRANTAGQSKLYATGRLFAVNSVDIELDKTGDPNKPELTASINLDAFVYGSAAPATPTLPGAATTGTTTTTTTAGTASAAGAPTGTG